MKVKQLIDIVTKHANAMVEDIKTINQPKVVEKNVIVEASKIGHFDNCVNDYKKRANSNTFLILQDLPCTINGIELPPKLYQYLADGIRKSKRKNPSYAVFFRRLMLNPCPLTIMQLMEHIEERIHMFNVNEYGDMSCIYTQDHCIVLEPKSKVAFNPKYIVDVGKIKLKYK